MQVPYGQGEPERPALEWWAAGVSIWVIGVLVGLASDGRAGGWFGIAGAVWIGVGGIVRWLARIEHTLRQANAPEAAGEEVKPPEKTAEPGPPGRCVLCGGEFEGCELVSVYDGRRVCTTCVQKNKFSSLTIGGKADSQQSAGHAGPFG